MDGLAFEHSTIKSRLPTGHEGPVSHKFIELARMTVARCERIFIANSTMYRPSVCVAQSGGRLDEGVEYRLQIERRTADNFSTRCGGLLLQGNPQFFEQARVLMAITA